MLTLIAGMMLGGCSGSVLDPVGPIGAAERTITIDATAVMLAIVVPVIVLTLAFGWWFRASNIRARYRPDWAYSGRIELVVWSVPALTIMLLGGIAWLGAHELDPAKPIASTVPPLDVQVVALDWKWLFIYPRQGVASVNRLVVPVGVPVRFSLTSASVMTSFFVPRLGSMIYVMNGMNSTLNLRADRAGEYRGMASHISGDGFADMHFAVDAVPPAAFGQWVLGARSNPSRLDALSYRRLGIQGVVTRPLTFGAVEPGLYEAVVSQRLAPMAGPQVGRGGPDVSPRTEASGAR